MIEQLILARLRQDTELTALLGATPEETRIDLLFTTLEDRAIVIAIVPINHDGVLFRSQLQLRLIESDAAVQQQISMRLQELLVMEEQQPAITFGIGSDTVVLYRCNQNGGGQLADDMEHIHEPIYFDLLWRYKHA